MVGWTLGCVGDGVCVPLCGVFLLPSGCAASRQQRGGDMAGRNSAQLPVGVAVDALRDEYLLVHHDLDHRWLWRSAPCQPGRDGVRHFFHVDELGAHGLHHWQHDKSHHPAHGAHPSLCKWDGDAVLTLGCIVLKEIGGQLWHCCLIVGCCGSVIRCKQ